MTYRLTPAAQRDLSSIWDYTEARWGLEQAEIYINEARSAIERVAVDPRRGRSCEEVRTGYRKYSFGSHVLFYVERADHIAIIRVLHQRMDPTLHLQ